jgi:hypothetical protein
MWLSASLCSVVPGVTLHERDPPPLPRPEPAVLELSVSELHEPIPVPRVIRIVDVHPLLLDPVRHNGVRPREAVKETPVGAGPKQRTCGSEPAPAARSHPVPHGRQNHPRMELQKLVLAQHGKQVGVSERSASGGRIPYSLPEKLRRTAAVMPKQRPFPNTKPSEWRMVLPPPVLLDARPVGFRNPKPSRAGSNVKPSAISSQQGLESRLPSAPASPTSTYRGEADG